MGDKTKRKLRVGDNKYHVVGEECKNYRRVSVYDDAKYHHYKKKNDIIYRTRRKAVLFGLGKFLFDPPSIDEMMKDCLNEAVCELEEKKEQEKKFSERVDDKLDTVKEIHENDA